MIRPFGKRREYFKIFGHPFTEDFIKKKREKKKVRAMAADTVSMKLVRTKLVLFHG